MSTKKVRLTFIIILLSFSHNVYSQSSPEKAIAIFFNIYEKFGSDSAINVLMSNTPFLFLMTNQISETKAKLKQGIINCGPYYGYEILATKSAGQNYVLYAVLAKHRLNPIIMHILFYRPKDVWQVQRFRFANDLDDQLDDAMKASHFKENN